MKAASLARNSLDAIVTVQLFVNETAGAWSHKRSEALQRAFEAAGARIILSPSDAGPLNIDDNADHICVVGGDGTLRHVAAAVSRTSRSPSISIYPTGTVNLIARECGYPVDPGRLLRAHWPTRPNAVTTFATIGQTILMGVASVGPDSLAVANLSPRLKQRIGRAAYVLSFLAILGRWPRPQLEIVADDRVIACEAVYIAKGRFFAGPWSFAPDAAVDRPLLHVVALKRATRSDFLRFAWKMWRGRTLVADPNIVGFSCSALALSGAGHPPLQADGDIVDRLPVRMEIASDTLSFA